MSTTNASKRSGARQRVTVPPLAKGDALAMLRSACGYVLQAGFDVRATTDGDRLIVVVHGAKLTDDRRGFDVADAQKDKGQ